MTMQDDNQGYPLPADSLPTGEIERSGESPEEEIAESYNPPPMDEDDVNFIPEAGLSKSDEEDIFGVGPRADGSIDEMERSDAEDLTGESDDLSDVLEVTEEDVMGKAPEPKHPKQFRRTVRPYVPPPSNLGGLQY